MPGDRYRPCIPGGHGGTGRRGMTVLEVVVVVSVVAVLAGILLVSLRGALDRKASFACMSHARQLGSYISAYASDGRDFFPTWVQMGVDYQASAGLWKRYTDQDITVMQDRRWLEYIGLGSASDILYCASNTWHPEMYSDDAAPDFILSSSMFMGSGYLNPDLATSQAPARMAARVQRLSTARFPSSKVGMYELFVWHGWDGDRGAGSEVGSLEYWQSASPGSVWFLDGHVRQIYERDATRAVNRRPVWPYMTFGTTPWGMQGRDLQ